MRNNPNRQNPRLLPPQNRTTPTKPSKPRKTSKNKKTYVKKRGKSIDISHHKKPPSTLFSQEITYYHNQPYHHPPIMSLDKMIAQSQENAINNNNTNNPNINLMSLSISQYNERSAFSVSPTHSSQIIKILPPKSEEFINKKTLLLDLDETLVHSCFSQYNPNIPSDIILQIELEKKIRDIHVLVRPGVEEFLKRMSKRFEVVIFTASLPKYAGPLLDILDNMRVCQFRLFREHCTFFNGAFIKDLKKIDRDLKDVILLDNSPIAYALHPNNGLPIKTWYDDKNDRELYNLAPIIEFLSFVDDVREFIPKLVFNNEISLGKAMMIISEYNDVLKQKQTKHKNNMSSNNNNNNMLTSMKKAINIKIVNTHNTYNNYISNNSTNSTDNNNNKGKASTIPQSRRSSSISHRHYYSNNNNNNSNYYNDNLSNTSTSNNNTNTSYLKLTDKKIERTPNNNIKHLHKKNSFTHKHNNSIHKIMRRTNSFSNNNTDIQKLTITKPTYTNTNNTKTKNKSKSKSKNKSSSKSRQPYNTNTNKNVNINKQNKTAKPKIPIPKSAKVIHNYNTHHNNNNNNNNNNINEDNNSAFIVTSGYISHKPKQSINNNNNIKSTRKEMNCAFGIDKSNYKHSRRYSCSPGKVNKKRHQRSKSLNKSYKQNLFSLNNNSNNVIVNI